MNFSIIIPTRNRYKVLQDTLLSLAEVEFPTENHEIIVVDNDSHDQTRQILKKLQKKIKNLHFCTESNLGVSFSRNTGAKQAKFQHLIFIDDDVRVKPSFLRGYQLAWRKYPDAIAMGGKIHPFLFNEPFSPQQQAIIQKWTWCFSHYDNGENDRALYLGELLFGPNMSCKKGDGENIFDARLGKRILNSYCLKAEEFEWCTRLMLEGKKVMYIADSDIAIQHLISISQFEPEYILARHYFAGIEHFVMDAILKEKFPIYQSFFKQEINFRLRQLLSFKCGDSLRFFLSKYKWEQFISYFFNGRYFYTSNNSQK